jgi:hypothetical protein
MQIDFFILLFSLGFNFIGVFGNPGQVTADLAISKERVDGASRFFDEEQVSLKVGFENVTFSMVEFTLSVHLAVNPLSLIPMSTMLLSQVASFLDLFRP